MDVDQHSVSMASTRVFWDRVCIAYVCDAWIVDFGISYRDESVFQTDVDHFPVDTCQGSAAALTKLAKTIRDQMGWLELT